PFTCSTRALTSFPTRRSSDLVSHTWNGVAVAHARWAKHRNRAGRRPAIAKCGHDDAPVVHPVVDILAPDHDPSGAHANGVGRRQCERELIGLEVPHRLEHTVARRALRLLDARP